MNNTHLVDYYTQSVIITETNYFTHTQKYISWVRFIIVLLNNILYRRPPLQNDGNENHINPMILRLAVDKLFILDQPGI